MKNSESKRTPMSATTFLDKDEHDNIKRYTEV